MLSLLIDGYNLLHAFEKGFISSLQEKREGLLAKLHEYQSHKQIPITIVFDGSDTSPLLPRRDKFGQIDIVYTDSKTTADEWIATACRKSPGNFVVISSDLEVARDAEHYGCLSMSSQEYLKKLKALTNAVENPYLEDKEDDGKKALYPRVSTKKKGVAKRLPKKERKKHHQLRNF